jgi:flagellar hook-associated protein 3 FlgL
MNIRSTQASTFALVQNGLMRNFSRLVDAQGQVSSGKRILRPSDDPIGSTRALTLHGRIGEMNRYLDAISGGTRALDVGATALQSAGELIAQAKSITLQALNGTTSPGDRRLLATQLREIKDQLLDLANTQHDGGYLFAGTKYLTKPYDARNVHGFTTTRYAGNGDQHLLLAGAD